MKNETAANQASEKPLVALPLHDAHEILEALSANRYLSNQDLAKLCKAGKRSGLDDLERRNIARGIRTYTEKVERISTLIQRINGQIFTNSK